MRNTAAGKEIHQNFLTLLLQVSGFSPDLSSIPIFRRPKLIAQTAQWIARMGRALMMKKGVLPLRNSLSVFFSLGKLVFTIPESTSLRDHFVSSEMSILKGNFLGGDMSMRFHSAVM